ncbi:hypothetical protein HG537_0A05210 [Torulaspora globosa]|uniref:Uncharacterized protein n=1 Tax=Torulaspora globosa TaxID=48254 RepID=A0A7H9HKC4_9SACH|nr:hypothetical protein HG537_0A05210 [Torulaspora sp. CBS 2947]
MKLNDGCLSFVGPSKIRTLVVPVGKWRREEFVEAVNKLQRYGEIRLLDITPIESSLFTPQGFPSGRLFFTFSSCGYNDSLNLFLYDFEPFRKIFVVIGLANEYGDVESDLVKLKERYPTVICHNLIVVSKEVISTKNSNVFHCGPTIEDNLETTLCDIGKNFLLALNHYYSSYKHVTLRSPGAIGGNGVLKTSLTRQITALNVATATSANTSKRLSSIEITTNSIKRSASLKLAKSLSTTENRSQNRSRGRQLKILGNFQLLAGRYTDALTSFSEAITLLHKVRDHLWLGSALDGIAICFLLLSYLQISFQIPSIINVLCPHQTSNNISETNSPRNSFSHAPTRSPRGSTSSLSSAAAIDVESANLPKLIKSISEKIMYYYELSLSHTSDYAPQMVYSEILLKTLSFMVCCRSGAGLSSDDLRLIIDGTLPEPEKFDCSTLEPAFTSHEVYFFANRLFDLQLKEMDVESQCDIYMHLAEVYRSLGFERKRAFVLRLLLVAVISNTEDIFLTSDYRRYLKNMTKLYEIKSPLTLEVMPDEHESVSWLTLQKRCLQLCLAVASRANDKKISAHYALLLIGRYTHLLTQSEQVNLLNNHLESLISNGYIDSYWDPYILRDIKFARLECTDSAVDGTEFPIEMRITTVEKQNDGANKLDTHQVFNPFKAVQAASKTTEPSSIQGTFLVGDRAMISCLVQNPFKFEIGITALNFGAEAGKHIELDQNDITLKAPIFISPESTRLVNLPVNFKAPTGNELLSINSLEMSVMGLPPRAFSMIPSENGFSGYQKLDEDQSLGNTVKIKVLPQQPELQVLRTENITDNSWMMLHGTKQELTIILRNKSLSCSIDYLQFSHLTSTEKTFKTDYWKKLPYDDLYGVEKQLEWLKNSCIKILEAPTKMAPNEVAKVKIEIDATSVPLQFDGFDIIVNYGMHASQKSYTYMKTLCLPYEVSLKRSIEVPGMEIVPLNELFAPEMQTVDWVEFIMNKKRCDQNFRVGDYVLLLLDIRNSWIDGVSLNLSFQDFHSHPYLIEAEHTTRVVVPIKKIEHQRTPFRTRPIPRVFHNRQYIQSGLNEDQEREMREKFWCREHILSHLQCQWHLTKDPTVTGKVDFRQFLDKFDDQMVTNLYTHRLPYLVDLTIDQFKIPRNQSILATVKITPTHSTHQTNEPLLLSFMIFDHQTGKILPNNSRRILYNGTMTRFFVPTKVTKISLQFIPIEPGIYEICALVTNNNENNPISLFNQEPVTLIVN